MVNIVIGILIAIGLIALLLTYLIIRLKAIVVEQTASISSPNGTKKEVQVHYITVPKLGTKGIEIMYRAGKKQQLLRYAIKSNKFYFSKYALALVILLIIDGDFPNLLSLRVITTKIVNLDTHQLPELIKVFDSKLG